MLLQFISQRRYKRRSFSCGFIQPLPRKQSFCSTSGFTLTEMLTVVLLVGILAAMASPSLRLFWSTRYLTAAQDEVFQAIRQAQTSTLRTHAGWQTSFREMNGVVQWAVHPTTTLPSQALWNNLQPGIRIDIAETTLPQTSGVYAVEFDYRGYVPPPFGRLTLSIENGGRLRRCVFASTLLGTLRKASENNTADSGGRYCY